MEAPARPSFIFSFVFSQVAAAAATAADWAVLFGLVELMHVWYVLAVVIGSIVGAIVNFLMNRHVSFDAAHLKWQGQALRYSVVSICSALLNAGGAYLLTDVLGLHYAISVITTSLLIGIFFNYPLHRYYVFK